MMRWLWDWWQRRHPVPVPPRKDAAVTAAVARANDAKQGLRQATEDVARVRRDIEVELVVMRKGR